MSRGKSVMSFYKKSSGRDNVQDIIKLVSAEYRNDVGGFLKFYDPSLFQYQLLPKNSSLRLIEAV